MVRRKRQRRRQQNHDFTPFFDAALALKSVRRAGWVAKAGIADAESVADHSFAMCAIGMALADRLGFDAGKAMKMIVLHDLAESEVGDYMPGEVAVEEKRAAEDSAMKKILASLPPKQRREYEKIWREFLEGRTRLARFVHRLDKLEMALQAHRYGLDGRSDKKLLEQFFESAGRAINAEDDVLSGILKALKAQAANR